MSALITSFLAATATETALLHLYDTKIQNGLCVCDKEKFNFPHIVFAYKTLLKHLSSIWKWSTRVNWKRWHVVFEVLLRQLVHNIEIDQNCDTTMLVTFMMVTAILYFVLCVKRNMCVGNILHFCSSCYSIIIS